MKKRLYTLILFLSVLTLFSACSDDENPLPNPGDYTDALTFFEDIDFNGSVLISKNGDDILRRGFGEANKSGGVLNNADTKFRIGSVSKTLTGMGVVQLKRDGLITGFDQPLSDLDADFPHGEEITIRHLLSHQSGVPDYLPFVETKAKSGEQISPEDIYTLIKTYLSDTDLDFEPGSSMAYSNTNFLIAALLIEELSGETYEDYIKANVLTPLDMTDTEMGTDEISGEQYAQGYNGNANVSAYPIEITLGAGCWTSTVGDLEKWCKAAMGDEWFSADEKELIFGGEVPAESTVFGLAWFKSKISGKTFLWHGGDIDGFASLIGFVPESSGVVIALSNQQDDTAAKRNSIIETIVTKEL
ncbi:serine hydrolase domain-containing protein [Sunxiuqinia dokdonensis]|nr:serine hydrolase domain-containing protein [Sunxiuqinia dokdonensis]